MENLTASTALTKIVGLLEIVLPASSVSLIILGECATLTNVFFYHMYKKTL
ncbi:MAG: hypothetical protein L6U99_07010 [Clostridium sp.]|nr:MAG: hypothetical protein L6U99_07010 [Clostridium sp.]